MPAPMDLALLAPLFIAFLLLAGIILFWLPQREWANRRNRKIREFEEERELRRQWANTVPVIPPNDLEDLKRASAE